MSEKKPKYSLGDSVWLVTREGKYERRTCPDCGGTRHFKAIFFDGTELTPECETCKSGYHGPTAEVCRYVHYAHARQVTIDGIETDPFSEGWRYSFSGSRIDEANVRPDAEAAEALRIAIQAEIDSQPENNPFVKTKDTKTWGWHVHYHRREIRECERKIAWHTERLNYAKTKVKPKEPA